MVIPWVIHTATLGNSPTIHIADVNSTYGTGTDDYGHIGHNQATQGGGMEANCIH